MISIKMYLQLRVNSMETKVNQALMEGAGDRPTLARVVLRRIQILCRVQVILKAIRDNHWFDRGVLESDFNYTN